MQQSSRYYSRFEENRITLFYREPVEAVEAHADVRRVSFDEALHFFNRLVGNPTQNGEIEGILRRELCSLQVGLRLHLIFFKVIKDMVLSFVVYRCRCCCC